MLFRQLHPAGVPLLGTRGEKRGLAEACVGRVVDVLLEKPGRMEGQLIGRSPWLQSVNVDAKTSQIGDIINVRITGTSTNSLFAEQV